LTKEQKPKFFVDAMLGKLAKKLRLLGYDTFYSSKVFDDEIIIMTKEQERILLTKDSLLAKLAQRNNIKTVNISEDDELGQFRQINEKVSFSRFSIEGKISRCSICNGKLSHIYSDRVIGKVPDGVINNFKEFWECNGCKKIYWERTHTKNLQKFVLQLNNSKLFEKVSH
jgi:hypothetical protein